MAQTNVVQLNSHLGRQRFVASRRWFRPDALFRRTTALFAGLVILTLLGMTYEMSIASQTSIARFGWRFVQHGLGSGA